GLDEGLQVRRLHGADAERHHLADLDLVKRGWHGGTAPSSGRDSSIMAGVAAKSRALCATASSGAYRAHEFSRRAAMIRRLAGGLAAAWAGLTLGLCAAPASAAPVQAAHMQAELVSETRAIAPGQTVWLAVGQK